MAAKDNDERKPDADDSDGSLDMSQAAVKKMIAEAREKGYITYDQLNQVLPPEQVSSEQIEDVMSMLSEMGINIIEDEEAEEEEQKQGDLVTMGQKGELTLGSGRPKSSTVPMILCACTCAKWALSNCSRAKAKSPSPSVSKRAATQ